MSISEQNKKTLILSIMHFLHHEASTTTPDKKESIEVAMQCLESAFEFDYYNEMVNNADIVNLLTLINRQTPQTENTLAEAEEYKTKGNELMRNGMYQEAVEQYTRAINLNPTNAVYFCNRAAAHSRLENHDGAIADCEEAVRLDPKYAKAYGRLGIAYSALNRYREARNAYQKALDIDPGNAMYEENMRLAEEHILATPLSEADGAENIDICRFMSNPNLLNMASQMLNDPGVRNMMSGLLNMGNENSNPNIDTLFQMGQQLAQQMQVNNPTFVDNLRRQFSSEASSATAESTSTSTTTTTTTEKKDEPPGSKKDGDASSN